MSGGLAVLGGALQVPPRFVALQMQLLSPDAARQFLRQTAGIKDLEPDLVSLEDQVIAAASGLPRKLKDFGLKLRGKTSPQQWRVSLTRTTVVHRACPPDFFYRCHVPSLHDANMGRQPIFPVSCPNPTAQRPKHT
jgi:hypothetical protein